MIPFLVAHITGLACLAGTVVQLRPRRHKGRHRATGSSTAQLMAEVETYLAALAPIAPLTHSQYQHKAGVGRYAHLRIAELDTTAEWQLKQADSGLTPKVSFFGTPEVADEWIGVS